VDDTWRQSIADLNLPDALTLRLQQVTEEFIALSDPGEAFATAPLVPPTYEDLGPLGAGGMGAVRRVHDPRLHRRLALKTLHPRVDTPAGRRRFTEEAQVMAQLQHPGIPPVHEVGTMPDGRPYFTMLEVRGQTLTRAIRAAHALGGGLARLRPLVEEVRRVAMTVAYAHSRGVVHRDLKPDNIMRGPFGEVWVMDWGLTRVTATPDAPTSVRESDPSLTQAEGIAGTPAFMAPEQGLGMEVDARTDVYALGGILYTVLVGALPRGELPLLRLLALLASNPPAPRPSEGAGWPVPDDLDDVCRGAMAARPEDRFADAGAFAEALGAWLDGHRARERARRLVEQARAHDANATRHHAEAARARREASDAPDTPEARWMLLDRVESETRMAQAEALQAERLLRSALTHAPLPAASEALADRAVDAHMEAERRGDAAAMQRYEAHIQEYGSDRHLAYLRGDGRLTLHTEPSGVEAVLFHYEERDWRLQAVDEVALGITPVDRPMARGSYLVELRPEGAPPVRYPVWIDRGRHWSGRPPGSDAPRPVPVEVPVGPGEIYVPPGPFVAGRDDERDADLHQVPRQEVWCHGFVVMEHPVTNEGYIAFLDDLVDQGREEEALRHAPQFGGEVVWERDCHGHFVLGEDAQGDAWHLTAPVVLVDWEDSRAFAAWKAERDGLPWRLGTELEWEKAARGVDGRPYPWGRKWHRSFCRMRASEAAIGPAPVEDFPADVSPYGVRHCAGNVTEWLQDAEPDAFALVNDGEAAPIPDVSSRRRRLKGGSWMYRARLCQVDGPASGVASVRLDYQGFRLFRDA